MILGVVNNSSLMLMKGLAMVGDNGEITEGDRRVSLSASQARTLIRKYGEISYWVKQCRG